ncbi:MAG: type II secretion system protein [Fimbriimonadaceae bacterium]
MRLRRKGTTLVELLVTIVFMAVAVGPIVSLITASHTRANVSKQRMLALGLAQNELESLKTLGRKGSVSTKNLTSSQTPTGATFPMTVSSRVVAGPLPNTFDATVTVTYSEAGHKLTLSTRCKS